MDKKFYQDSGELIPVITPVNGSHGKISYYKSQCHINDNGENSATCNTTIFRGVFEKKMIVCVRRFKIQSISDSSDTKGKSQTEKVDQMTRDINALQEPHHLHENFIRYICSERNADFVYVATEWCICSVEDLYGSNKKENWAGEKIDADIIKNSLGEKELLRQATEGLSFLHALGFVHRNLKPSNFLIAQLQRRRGNGYKYLVKLSDFRMSKSLVKQLVHSGQRGSGGWISPYPKPPKPEKNASTDNNIQPKLSDDEDKINTHPTEDVFILGCFFHYVMTNGKHPFGDFKLEREKNINDPNCKVYDRNWNPSIGENNIQAIRLLKDMIKFDPKERPALKTILDRAYFLPDDYYKLYDVPNVKPGLCVIFNQEKFNKKENNRPGSGEDKKALTILFTKFGFDVTPHDNLTAKQLKHEINQLAKKSYTEYACLVVCLLSHGDEGVICGCDNKTVSIEDLKKTFCGYVVPSLVGKPKIWIIQACQGNKLQENQENQGNQQSSRPSYGSILWNWIGNQMDYQQRLPPENEIILPRQQTIPAQNPADIPRPPISDYLDVRATIPGCPSFRDPKNGSVLIQHLNEQLQTNFLDSKQSHRYHLEDLLKKVQKKISVDISWIPINEKDKNNESINKTFKRLYNSKKKEYVLCKPCKQTIEWRSTLIDFIRFEKASSTEHSQNAPVDSN